MKNCSLSPAEAAQELLRRRRARASLLDFAKYVEIPGKPVSDDPDEWVFAPVETGLAAHHALILNVMEQVVTGKIPRAMFFLPPGSGKSSYGSVVAPSWGMGKFPGLKIILSSYGSDLARKHGRRARQLARSREFNALFNARISSETSAADEWALTNGSEYLACGILSGITGNRAHGIIIDDPVKGRQEADSETVQARTWDVYQEDLRTRLIPGGWEIIIQTRWNEEDISGKLLPKEYRGESGLIRCRDGRDWYIVCIPAEREAGFDDPLNRQVGEYLWPEWFPLDHWTPFKQNPRTWSALFQQRPQPDEGTYFKKDWFPRYAPDELPRFLHLYGSSDFAVTDEQDNEDADYTEHGIIGLDPNGESWVKDWWFGQTESNVWIERVCDLIKLHKPFCWFGEAGQIRRAIAPYWTRRMRERRALCRLEFIPSVANKATRARAFQAMAAPLPGEACGRVHLPLGPIGDRIINQCVHFLTSPDDHAVDVLSLFFMALDNAHPAISYPDPIKRSLADVHIDMIEAPPQSISQDAMEHARELARGNSIFTIHSDEERDLYERYRDVI